MEKGPYTRRCGFSGSKLYKSYVESLKNRNNAVDGTFYDAIIIAFKKVDVNPFSTLRALFSALPFFRFLISTNQKYNKVLQWELLEKLWAVPSVLP